MPSNVSFWARPAAVLGLIVVLGSHAAAQEHRERLHQTAATPRVAQMDERIPSSPLDFLFQPPSHTRQLVRYAGGEPPGTIVVDTRRRFVYLIQSGGTAIRYAVGVGREGMEFRGAAVVGMKREWPRWTPTPNMIKREPRRYARWAEGMEGGPHNPLGARALYLFRDGRDTLFRIHGTNEPESIGHAASSGCIRMMNHDVIDLYQRVQAGARVVVR